MILVPASFCTVGRKTPRTRVVAMAPSREKAHLRLKTSGWLGGLCGASVTICSHAGKERTLNRPCGPPLSGPSFFRKWVCFFFKKKIPPPPFPFLRQNPQDLCCFLPFSFPSFFLLFSFFWSSFHHLSISHSEFQELLWLRRKTRLSLKSRCNVLRYSRTKIPLSLPFLWWGYMEVNSPLRKNTQPGRLQPPKTNSNCSGRQ